MRLGHHDGSVDVAGEARITLAFALAERGRSRQALEQIDQALGELDGVAHARALVQRGTILLELGRHSEAVRSYRSALPCCARQRTCCGSTGWCATAAWRTPTGNEFAAAEADLRQAERLAGELMLQLAAKPPQDPVVAQALAELRGTIQRIIELRDSGQDGAAVARLERRQTALERQVRDHSRQRKGVSGQLPAPVAANVLAEQLGSAALLELVVFDGALLAITLVAGRTRLHSLGPMSHAEDLIDRIGFALHRLLRRDGDTESSAAARKLLRHAAGRIDELLLRPLPELADRPLVIVPTGKLQCLPWAILPSCAARPVTVSPSATLWHTVRTRAVAAVYGIEPMLPTQRHRGDRARCDGRRGPGPSGRARPAGGAQPALLRPADGRRPARRLRPGTDAPHTAHPRAGRL